MTNSEEIETNVAQFLKEQAIKITVTYNGEHEKSKGEGKWTHDLWSVRIVKGGKSDSFSFRMGLGHRATVRKPGSVLIQARDAENRFMWAVPPKPADFFHSACLDATAVDTSFHFWCDDYGFSDDSIEALDIYRACCDIGLRLNDLLGSGTMRTIRELVSEY